MFSGDNGAGKTTIFDAIQFTLMGGDQRLTRYNAAADGRTSERTARSYALGEFQDNDSTSLLRDNANSYIFLNFYDELKRPYSFGLTFYASKQSPSVEKIRGHIIKGYHVTESDLLSDEGNFLPWVDFVEHMKRTAKGLNGAMSYETVDGARIIREKIAELMSRNQTRTGKIESNLLVKTLSSALQLKMDSPIDVFIRDFILPPMPIETEQLREDLIAHQRIEEEIERAESHKSEREALLKECENISNFRVATHHAKWVSQEAEISRLNQECDVNEDEKEKQCRRLKHAKSTLELQSPRLPKLQADYDDAVIAWNNSDSASLNRTVSHASRTVEEYKNQLHSNLESIQAITRNIRSFQFPDTLNLQSFELFAQQWGSCLNAIERSGIHQLSISAPGDIVSVADKLNESQSLISSIGNLVEVADKDVSKLVMDLRVRGESTQKRLDRLCQGLSDINQATAITIHLLQGAGISATPVCDVCEISDKAWQQAIESYLGTNREALLVSPDDFEQVLELYEIAQQHDGRIKRARIINPDHALKQSRSPSAGMVSSLVETSDPVARGFMNIVLNRTRIAKTLSDLRRETKALMASGLATGGGTVGGTSNISGLMIGKSAKLDQQKLLEIEIQEVTKLLVSAKDPAVSLSKLNQQWAKLSSELSQRLIDAQNISSQYLHALNSLKQAQEQLKPLSSEDMQLELAKKQAELELSNCNVLIIQANSDVESISPALEKLDEVIGLLSTKREEAEQHRTQMEQSALHDDTKADQFWQKYEEKFDDGINAYSLIRIEAEKEAQKLHEKEIRARGVLREKIIAFTNYYSEDIANRQELLEAARQDNNNVEAYLFIEADCRDWIERILSVKLLQHRQAAQAAAEQMEQNFRGIIVGELQSRFEQMKFTFNQLNNLLKKIPFHDNIYSFHYSVVESKSLKEVYDYITTADREETELVGTMFDLPSEHEAIGLLKSALINGDDLINEIKDYRNFFTYDMKMKNKETGEENRISKMQGTGSGGEQQTPAYIALAASFMNVYKIGSESGQGASIVLLDEAFNNMDAGNASAAVAFLKEIGLQLLIAAPPEVTLKIGKEMDQIYTICREGRDVAIDHTKIYERGQEFIDQSNPAYHPELISERVAELKTKATSDV
ncbi:hypothetical protein C942_00688 [Photobacterium marinum]|uniref:Uncharacterized protein n=1 Tax=Photobacterium marinum TaxID=1056511 RepID=L8J9Q0_9GAMM|nr:hypothetical protein C942_00688 [Photobacterium marinum]